MNSSFMYSFDEQSRPPSGKRGLIVKHDPNRSISRPKTKKVENPAILEKRVESLEKKQELWKEREQVWGKEKKSLKFALKNVKNIQAVKDPDEYYRNLLNNWHQSHKNLRPPVDSFSEGLEKVRNFLNWVLEQHGETPLKYIQKLAKEQFLNLEKLENDYRLRTEEKENNSNRMIESLRRENEQLTEKMTSGMQDVISCLQIKIQELTNELLAAKKEVESKKVKVNRLKKLIF
jgi:hypothetical protein